MSYNEQVALGKLIQAGLNAISHATAGAGSEVAYSINGLAKATKEAAEIKAAAIKQAGYQIAQGAITSASIMCQGLAKISDEMEQRRKQEEYYLLLKQIDETEDKIQKRDGDLRAIYDNMDFSNIPEVFEMSLPEVIVILELFGETKPYDWLVSTSRLTLSNPFSIICGFLVSSGFKFRAYSAGHNNHQISLHLGGKLGEKFLYRVDDDGSFASLNGRVSFKKGEPVRIIFNTKHYPKMKEIVIPITSLEESDWSRRYEEENLDCSYFSDGYYLAGRMLSTRTYELSIPLNCVRVVAIVAELLKKHEHTTLCDLCADRVSDVSNLKALEAQINCEIILSQLRYIDGMLRKAYRDLKFK